MCTRLCGSGSACWTPSTLRRFLGGDEETNAQSTDGAAAENTATDGATGGQSNSSDSLYSKDDVVTQKQFANEGMAYARDVEVNNGRWAMLG